MSFISIKTEGKVCVPILPHFPLRGLIYLLLSPTPFVRHSVWLVFPVFLADFGHLDVLACTAPCSLVLSGDIPDSGQLTAGHSQESLLTRNRTQRKPPRQKGRGRRKEKTVEMETAAHCRVGKRPRAKGLFVSFSCSPAQAVAPSRAVSFRIYCMSLSLDTLDFDDNLSVSMSS